MAAHQNLCAGSSGRRDIEGVQLFGKTFQERNAEFRKSPGRQGTATSEVLGIISRWPTRCRLPVLNAIVESAARVCRIDDVTTTPRGRHYRFSRAHFGIVPLGRSQMGIDEPRYRWMREQARSTFPMSARKTISHRWVPSATFAPSYRSPSSAGETHWSTVRASHRCASLHSGADQAARNLCRSGGNRH